MAAANSTAVERRALSASEIARLFGVHRNTISEWVKRGCPAVHDARREQGRAWRLDPAAVLEWRESEAARAERERMQAKHRKEVERLEVALAEAGGQAAPVSLEEGRRREQAAKARLAEIELAERERDVVRVADASRVVQNFALTIRSRLRSLGARLAPRLRGADDSPWIREQIDNDVDQALREIAKYDPAAGQEPVEAETGA